MRRIAWILLLFFAFSIPWEYSLDLGEPLGNVARIAGVLLLLAAVPAILQAGRIRIPNAFCWVALGFFLWLCLSYFWSIDATETVARLRAYFQVMMILWLVWEFADTPDDLRNLLRATVAGLCVLAVLTLLALRSPEAIAAGQIRYAAYGQDPNEVARYLDLGFPLAALLAHCERRWLLRTMAIGFLLIGGAAVLLTASRSGFIAALVAFAGALAILGHGRMHRVAALAYAIPPLLGALWIVIPAGTIARLATIPEQLQGGDLNQRVNIWQAGWDAFQRAPLAGTGAGSFVAAARLAPIDTAHNTMLSILVSGGLVAFFLVSLLLALAARAAFQTHGPLRVALATCLVVWAITSLIATAEENRTTWLLFGIVILAARVNEEDPFGMAGCFHFAPLSPARGPEGSSTRLAEV